ncbi:MAG TPA: homocysteine S-methyltransferase family protein [Nitrospirota bacterium]
MTSEAFLNRMLEKIRERVLLIDGAMGTMLQEAGMKPGSCPEELNASGPDIVLSVHRKYAAAGADVLTTNTFGGSRPKLAEYGLEGRLAELNGKAVEIAKKAAAETGREMFVMGDMGPTGMFLQPIGEMSFDQAVEIFAEQARALEAAGADCILVETMSDIKEARAAVIAAKAATKLPVIATMTFQQNLRSLMGTPPDAAIAILEAAGADVIGANCSLGPEGLLEAAKVMKKIARVPLVFQPNAGLPVLVDGKTVFPDGPEVLADYADKFIALGIGMLGSCCGSNPAHTAAMAERVKKSGARTLSPRPEDGITRFASRTRLVHVGPGCAPAIIGERINPTGRKDLSAELAEGKLTMVKREAKGQTEAGALLIDINVGLPGGDEKALMPKVVRAVEESTDLPVVIDSTDPKAIEAALKETGGKPLVNSVTGDADRLGTILPLVKKYGAAVVGLTIDETGVPATAEARVAIARRILAACESYGIPKEDLIIDCLVMTASAEQDQAVETLKAVRIIREDLGLSTSLGVSNISFGLPNRPLINSTYLAMALGAGLDAAMVNSYDTRITDAMAASAVLTGRDKRAEAYIAAQRAKAPGSADKPRTAAIERELTLEEKLRAAVINGDREGIVPLVSEALAAGKSPMEVGNGCLIPALTEVGKLYEAKEFFLPQVMQSAEAMKAAFAKLKESMDAGSVEYIGTVVIATVFGDVHDIGKNILSTLLENHGIKVVDLGKNVTKEAILDAAAEAKADVIGLSALMTTTMTQMEEVIKERDARGMTVPVVLGGAVVTEAYAESVGAAGCSRDALEAVELFKKIIGK